MNVKFSEMVVMIFNEDTMPLVLISLVTLEVYNFQIDVDAIVPQNDRPFRVTK